MAAVVVVAILAAPSAAGVVAVVAEVVAALVVVGRMGLESLFGTFMMPLLARRVLPGLPLCIRNL